MRVFLLLFIINRIIAEHQKDASFYINNIQYTQNIFIFEKKKCKQAFQLTTLKIVLLIQHDTGLI